MKKEMTVSEWLNTWLYRYAVPSIKPSTAVSYECYVRKHIIPAIGNVRMADLNLDILQDFFNEEAMNYSPKTLRNERMMLHTSFRLAILNDVISKNYIEYVRLPTVHRTEMRVLTLIEQKKLMAELRRTEERLGIGVLIALATGIRIGELCGLQWKHIDFDRGYIYIRQTVQRIKCIEPEKTGHKTILMIDSPKSEASVRDIPLDDALHNILLNYMKKITTTKPDDYILTLNNGKPVEPKTVAVCFKRIVRDAGIKPANFHALRHTFATRALEAGIDFKTLSVILGHSDFYVTMTRYAHVLDDQKRNAMKSITSVIL